MAFDLFRFVTPMAAQPDPNGGVANALHGLGMLSNRQVQDAQIKQQADQFERAQQHAATNEAWARQKDIVSALDKYNNILATDPEKAPLFESELRALGVQFHPAEQPNATAAAARDIVVPPGAPAEHGAEELGEHPAETASAEKAETAAPTITPQQFKAKGFTPDKLATAIGGDEPAPPEMQPAKVQRGGKPIPLGLRGFMAEQARVQPEASAAPSLADIAQSAENVRSIGGTPQEPNAPIDPNVGPPEEIAQALKKPMTPAEYQALGPMPGMNPIALGRAPVAPSAAMIPELLRSGKMTGAEAKALADAGIPLNSVTPQPKYSSSESSSVSVHQRGPTVKAPDTPEGQAASVALQAQGVRPALPAYRASWNGIDLGTFDPEAARQTLKRQASETATGYATATTEKYRPLVEALINSGHSPEEVTKMMGTFVGPEVLHLIGADAAVRAAGKKGNGPPASETLAEEKDGRASVREFTSSAENPGLQDDIKAVKYLPKLMESLKNPKNGMDASFVVREIMLALNKGAFSDKDAAAYMTDVSMWDKFKNLVSRQQYSSIDKDMLSAIAGAVEHKLELAEENVGSAYNTLVESNQYERGNSFYKRGRRLAAQQVFGGTKFWKPGDWTDSEVSPKAGPRGPENAEAGGESVPAKPAPSKAEEARKRPVFLQ